MTEHAHTVHAKVNEHVWYMLDYFLPSCLAHLPACLLGLSTARFYVACIVLAIEHLHKHFICFRDLKPENLLVSPPVF